MAYVVIKLYGDTARVLSNLQAPLSAFRVWRAWGRELGYGLGFRGLGVSTLTLAQGRQSST